MNPTQLEQLQLERDRRQVFTDSYIAGSSGWTELKEMQIFAATGREISATRLRNILDYLEDLGLVELRRTAVDWKFSITAHGCQAYEGNGPWPIGIAECNF